MDDVLKIGDYVFQSRLIVGTGKYSDTATMLKAHAASGAEMITVAIRRVDLDNPDKDANWFAAIDRDRYTILPNTAGAYTAEEAIRIAHLSRAAGMGNLIKLEVLGDQRTLLPDVHATVSAAEILVKEGFTVLAYTSDDLITARKLEKAGVAAVMPLASPIGSGRGVLNALPIRFIREEIALPVIVDAGVGTASHAAYAMELGIDGILMNTAIAAATEPVRMAQAMKLAVEAGRQAFLAGRMAEKIYASPSSPVEGIPGK
jgi:thiazole synthase